MLGGIAFQLGTSSRICTPSPPPPPSAISRIDRTRVSPPRHAAAVSIYMILAAEFLLRYWFDKPFHRKGGVLPKSFQLDRGVKLMILGLALDGVFILIRCVSHPTPSRVSPSHNISYVMSPHI